MMIRARRLVVVASSVLGLLVISFIMFATLLPSRVNKTDTLTGYGGFTVFDENLTVTFFDPAGYNPEEFSQDFGSFSAIKNHLIETGNYPEEFRLFTRFLYGTGSGAVIFNFKINISLFMDDSKVFSVEEDMTGPRSLELGSTMHFLNELQYSLCLNRSGLYAETTNLLTKSDPPWTDGKFTNASTPLAAANYTLAVGLRSIYVPSSFSDAHSHDAIYDVHTMYLVEYYSTTTFEYLMVAAALLSFAAGALIVYGFAGSRLHQLKLDGK